MSLRRGTASAAPPSAPPSAPSLLHLTAQTVPTDALLTYATEGEKYFTVSVKLVGKDEDVAKKVVSSEGFGSKRLSIVVELILSSYDRKQVGKLVQDSVAAFLQSKGSLAYYFLVDQAQSQNAVQCGQAIASYFVIDFPTRIDTPDDFALDATLMAEMASRLFTATPVQEGLEFEILDQSDEKLVYSVTSASVNEIKLRVQLRSSSMEEE